MFLVSHELSLENLFCLKCFNFLCDIGKHLKRFEILVSKRCWKSHFSSYLVPYQERISSTFITSKLIMNSSLYYASF